jgi:hypothetical protein
LDQRPALPSRASPPDRPRNTNPRGATKLHTFAPIFEKRTQVPIWHTAPATTRYPRSSPTAILTRLPLNFPRSPRCPA